MGAACAHWSIVEEPETFANVWVKAGTTGTFQTPNLCQTKIYHPSLQNIYTSHQSLHHQRNLFGCSATWMG